FFLNILRAQCRPHTHLPPEMPMNRPLTRRVLPLLSLSCLVALAACSGEPAADTAAGFSGTVSIDGSSTVYPVTEAVAEEFLSEAPQVRVTVGVSGTGGGFKKFVAGEIDINDASRTIKESEAAEA